MKKLMWPLTVEQYMNYALYDPEVGYYMKRFPLGSQGDFITAPEISQLFGEMLGVWACALWEHLGQPNPVHVVELGPGRGTLMHDIVRVIQVFPGFQKAFKGHLVEISPLLRAAQKITLGSHQKVCLEWHDHIGTLPDGPCIVLANEFFDALPVRQYVRGPLGWHERLVDCNDREKLFFRISDSCATLVDHPYAPDMYLPQGTILEVNESARCMMRTLTQRLMRHDGALLIIDYGGGSSGFGDTLQALYNHAFMSPLERMGYGDLTAHVDFEALAHVSREEGGVVYGPVRQKDFLSSLGIMARVNILKKRASLAQKETLENDVSRLLASGPTGMGDLFGVMAVSKVPLGSLPGF